MYRPRKTTDLLDEEKTSQTSGIPTSNPRTSRISRLTQHNTRQNARSMSNNRASTVNHQSEHSSASKPRSSRSVSATPLRTPQHRTTTGTQGTAEKDRKTLHEQAGSVMERLRSHPAFTAELLQSGLKPITTKQFVAIVSVFMKSVVGNARGNRIANINTDDIAQWLTQIHYPHLQSRSWLKTPNVPHAFAHLVDLMQWLSHFIAVDAADCAPTFRKADYYIRDYISSSFLDVVSETFILWNTNKHEDQQQHNQDRLINEYVHRRIGLASAKEAKKETKKITCETAKLNKERPATNATHKTLLESQQTKQQQLKQDQHRFATALRDQQQMLQRLKTEFKCNEKHQTQLEQTQHQLHARIKQQTVSKDDFNKLLELCAQKRLCNKAERDTNAHLVSIEYKQQLTYSQRLKQMSEYVAKLNMFVHEVAEILQLSSFQHLCVDTRSAALQVSLPPIVRCLEEIVAKNRASHNELSALSSQLRIDVQRVNTEVRSLQTDLVDVTKQCATVHDRLMQFEDDVSLADRAQMQKTLVKTCAELQTRNCQRIVELKSKRAHVLVMGKMNEQLLQETETTAHQLINAKQERVNQAQASAKELAHVLAVVRSKWEMAKQIGKSD